MASISILDAAKDVLSLTVSGQGIALADTSISFGVADPIAQAAAAAAGGAADLLPAFSPLAFELSAAAYYTGSSLLNEYATSLSAEAATEPPTPLTLEEKLQVVGQEVTVVSDILGMVGASFGLLPALHVPLSVASLALSGLSAGISTAQLSSTQLQNFETSVVKTLTGIQQTLDQQKDTAVAVFTNTVTPVLTQLDKILSAVITIVQNPTIPDTQFITSTNTINGLFSGFNALAFAFISNKIQQLTDVVMQATSTGVTFNTLDESEGGTNNFIIPTDQGDVNLDTTIYLQDPASISAVSTISQDGSESLSTEEQSGGITVSSTSQIVDGLIVGQELSLNGTTIDVPQSDPVAVTVGANDAPAFDITSQNPEGDVTVVAAGDGSDQVFIGGDGNTSAQSVIDYAPSGLTVTLSQ